jgi:hypothetical protein
VGCSSTAQKLIKKKMKLEEIDLLSTIRCFDDPEIAKQWLLGKIKD